MSNGDAHYKADRDETRMVIGIWMNMIKVALERPRYLKSLPLLLCKFLNEFDLFSTFDSKVKSVSTNSQATFGPRTLT